MSVACQVDEILERFSMLKHPFYQAWSEGKLTQAHLADYAVQYYQHVLAFPTYVSGVHFNTPDFDGDISVRQSVLENLIEEEHGEGNHPGLWRDFAKALGVDSARLSGSEKIPEVVDLIDYFRHLCVSSPFYVGLAALYAYESQIPEVSAVKIDGLRRFYGLDDPKAYRFFSVHQVADVEHAELAMSLIETFADTDEKRQQVLEAVEQIAQRLWKFLDGVYHRYCSDLALEGCSTSQLH